MSAIDPTHQRANLRASLDCCFSGGNAILSPNLAEGRQLLEAHPWKIGGLTGLTAPSPQPSPSPGAVPGLGDVQLLLLGTALCVLVIYAIVAAHRRKED